MGDGAFGMVSRRRAGDQFHFKVGEQHELEFMLFSPGCLSKIPQGIFQEGLFLLFWILNIGFQDAAARCQQLWAATRLATPKTPVGLVSWWLLGVRTASLDLGW